MENEPTFDLNSAIERWRTHLEATGTFRPKELEELELHLRDSMVSLTEQGVPDEEEWWLARKRLGSHDALESEFEKVSSWQRIFASLFESSAETNAGHTANIERKIVLPIKAAFVAIFLYTFYSSPWIGTVLSSSDVA